MARENQGNPRNQHDFMMMMMMMISSLYCYERVRNCSQRDIDVENEENADVNKYSDCRAHDSHHLLISLVCFSLPIAVRVQISREAYLFSVPAAYMQVVEK